MNTAMADALVGAMAEGKVRVLKPGRETEMALLEVQDKERVDQATKKLRLQEEREAEARQVELDEVTKSHDPVDQAYALIMGSADLEKKANVEVAALVRTFKETERLVDRAKRYGGEHLAAFEHLGGDPLDAAKRFERFAVAIRKKIEAVLAKGNKRSSGMIGR